ncbi:MAG: hypothetical protein B7Z74_08110 [Deltaproteobacteria bacterium 21-66-5]|nr:MAG: hypothetical protein B7Z74_08110 [Deltaproteobacteria bacterium 21-66-5]
MPSAEKTGIRDRELAAKHPELERVPLVADVGDEGRMRMIFEAHRPAVVVHAAAHKHVPMMEWNPCEAVKNNILGTEVTGRLAGEHGAEAFVLISTDKAVKPSSVMGASKRMAELVVQALDKRYDTRYVAVRFGNVLGSTGLWLSSRGPQAVAASPFAVTARSIATKQSRRSLSLRGASRRSSLVVNLEIAASRHAMLAASAEAMGSSQ